MAGTARNVRTILPRAGEQLALLALAGVIAGGDARDLVNLLYPYRYPCSPYIIIIPVHTAIDSWSSIFSSCTAGRALLLK